VGQEGLWCLGSVWPPLMHKYDNQCAP
jgi:hypothetical protein